MSKKKPTDILKEEVVIAEAYATAIFWNKPDNYAFYPVENINSNTFQNDAWGFFFSLGRYMKEKGVAVFDDISAMKHVNELGDKAVEKFNKYGGFETVQEVMNEVKGKEENLETYYREIKKYEMLKKLVELLGNKVLIENGKYNYKKMQAEQIYAYWNFKLNEIGMTGDNNFEECLLLDNLEEAAKDWDENPTVGLPFFKSRYMTKICTGWDYGHVYIYGGFGGSGKTSLTFNKVIMSCIEQQEPLVIIANEQGIDEFKKMLVTTSMGTLTKNPINRQRLNEGGFTEEEWGKIDDAINAVHELAQGDKTLIRFVFMNDYIMDDVKKIVKYYASKGIRRFLIDTGKPSEGGASEMARWERFTEDFKELYKLARPNGGGLNVAIWVNVQLADSALKMRYLNEFAFGESKKIKNEASVVFMGRFVWDDEYSDGDRPLKVTRHVKTDPNNPKHDQSKPYSLEEVKLDRQYEYYLLFTPKNRRGQDNRTGQKVLVLRPDFNSNRWIEVGWTTVSDDKNY